MSEAVEAVVPAEGWGVLHLFFRITGDRSAAVDLADTAALVDAFVAEEPYQAHWSATLGSRADIGLMLIGPDLVRLQRFHRDLLASELGSRLAEVPELGFVSLTELAEYTPRGDEPRLVAMREARLHPRLPTRRVIAFYPMSKRRAGRDNWYELPFEERLRLMEGHGRIGRTYAGKVLQLITGSTGPLRLGVGRDAARGRSQGPQGDRPRDALRRGVVALRRVRPVHGRARGAVRGRARARRHPRGLSRPGLSSPL